MLVGHFAVAFVGKRIEPKVSLGTLTLAAMLPDVLWPIFSIAKLEYTAGRTEAAWAYWMNRARPARTERNTSIHE